jgi:N6-adenosine-specific RNA methylase IME4
MQGPDRASYSTIVADPPWPYPKSGGGYPWREGKPSGEGRGNRLPYPTMTVEEIAGLDVPSADAAHLYVWTTQRFLRDTYKVVEAWGFTPAHLLVWAKAPRGFNPGGLFGSCCEFVMFARKGKLKTLSKVERDWFEWKRGQHSAKPEAFLDMVEQVSPGPYLEMFARRNRMGWSAWGNEAISDVEIGA